MSGLSFTEAVRAGLDASNRGAFGEAASRFREALAKKPEDAETLSLYGTALLRAGRAREAEKPLREATAREPGEPGFAVNLAEFLIGTGRAAAAVDLLEPLLAQHPKYAHGWRMLGEAHIALRDYQTGADALDKALQLDGDNYDLAVRLARALGASGNFKAADYVLGHAERLQPDGLPARRAHVQISAVQGNWNYVEMGAQRILVVEPDDLEAWRWLSAAFIETGRYGDAQKAFANYLSRGVPTAADVAQFAKICLDVQDFAQAEKALAEAEKLGADQPDVLSTKALFLMRQGKREEAEALCRRCLEIDPEFLPALAQLGTLTNGALADNEEKSLLQRARLETAPSSIRSRASFLLAKSRDAHERFDEAFKEYLYANSLVGEQRRREGLEYDHQALTARTQEIIDSFSEAPPAGDAFNEGLQPIFIVGLPFSGKALVENVLAAHSRVTPGGELPFMPQIFADWMAAHGSNEKAQLASEEAAALAAKYSEHLPQGAGDGFITDRNALNIEAAGFIAHLFPHAIVINVRRNPVETGFSIFRNDLPKFWTFANDLGDIGRRYGLYARLADHFEKLMPDRFHTVQYEDLIGDADAARRLIERCGLDWEDACATALKSVQSEDARAGAYQPYLAPLHDALTEESVDLETGALRQ